MATALLAYDATIDTDQRQGLTIGHLLGDGSNGGSDHALQPDEVIQSATLPIPLDGERALYKRAIGRSHAEWPLVEVCARAVVENGSFRFVHLAAGGVAPVPLRLRASEAVLLGAAATAETLMEAARRATSNASPLPMTRYKLALLSGLVQDLLEQMVA
jgi:xanthine dehydrogenase YagS FAD-binding subunit